MIKVLIVCLTLIVSQTYAQDTMIRQILWTADWSPNGKYIAIGGNLDTLQLYQSKNLQHYKSIPMGNTITCVKWHPTQNVLAVGTQMSKDKVCLLFLDTGKKIELTGISTDGARGIDWNFNGEYLAVADNDGQIAIFDVNGHLVSKINHENTKGITGIDWHPTKNIFITVGDKIRIFDIEGTLLKTIMHRKEATLLLSVAWHPSGSFFATGDYGDDQEGYQSLLQFWTANGDLIMTNDTSKGEYRNLRWNHKGTKLATASDALRLWDAKGNLIADGASDDYLWGLSWNKKGHRIVTSSIRQEVIIWDDNAKRKQKLD
ncbi:MAG: WD40 repeat domain-containing protein [Saprospiraceae bacterium]|nr:WD40 repeat domain-containing protein [Saprospiraceae bacterium]